MRPGLSRGSVAFVTLVGTLITFVGGTGCGPLEPSGTEERPIEFETGVKVIPAVPVPGRSVSLKLELLLKAERPVVADLELFVRDAGDRLVYEQYWWSLAFEPKVPWDVTQAFINGTDPQSAPRVVALRLRDPSSGSVLHDAPSSYVFGAR